MGINEQIEHEINALTALILDVDGADAEVPARELAEALHMHGVRVIACPATSKTGTRLLGPEDERCAGPYGHSGWHASAPRVAPDGRLMAGSTWGSPAEWGR